MSHPPKSLKVSTWLLAALVVVLAFNISFQEISNVGAQSQVVGEGTVGHIAVWVEQTFTPLSVSLTADPISGDAPLNDVDLTATVTTSSPDPFNYTFYCDRADSGTDITLPWDAKFDGVTDNPKLAVDVCDYATGGAKTAKVIVEQGTDAAEDRTPITVASPALFITSCSASPSEAVVNEDVSWFTEVTGGDGPGTYSFVWSGDTSTPPLSSITTNPATVSYDTPCDKTASVTVTSGTESVGPASCGTVAITTATIIATPPFVNPTKSSVLEWTGPGFDTCTITDDLGNTVLPPTDPSTCSPSCDVSVTPFITTTYTLECSSAAALCGGTPFTGTSEATISVSGIPRFREIPPE